MIYLKLLLTLIDDRLQACLFLLLGMGLLLASALMYLQIIESGDWATVCSVLFGSNSLGHGLAQFARSKPELRA